MSDPATIAREYLESFNRRDFERIRALFDSGYSYTGGDGQRQDGPQAGIDVVQGWATAMPDAKITIKKIHTAGDTAIVEFIGSGTHQGDLMGIAPTGRRMSIPVCMIVEVRDGKIVAEREYMDMAHLMQQIGAMPAPATA